MFFGICLLTRPTLPPVTRLWLPHPLLCRYTKEVKSRRRTNPGNALSPMNHTKARSLRPGSLRGHDPSATSSPQRNLNTSSSSSSSGRGHNSRASSSRASVMWEDGSPGGNRNGSGGKIPMRPMYPNGSRPSSPALFDPELTEASLATSSLGDETREVPGTGSTNTTDSSLYGGAHPVNKFSEVSAHAHPHPHTHTAGIGLLQDQSSKPFRCVLVLELGVLQVHCRPSHHSWLIQEFDRDQFVAMAHPLDCKDGNVTANLDLMWELQNSLRDLKRYLRSRGTSNLRDHIPCKDPNSGETRSLCGGASLWRHFSLCARGRGTRP